MFSHTPSREGTNRALWNQACVNILDLPVADIISARVEALAYLASLVSPTV